MPRKAYDPRRMQYSADIIMNTLRSKVDELGTDLTLGITDADLYVPHLNFIFGQSECPGKVAIVSTHRLKPEFYGGKPDRSLFLERCAKECIHEIGHSYGLMHCEKARCVMAFSNSIGDTDYKTADFCPLCRSKLEGLIT